MRKFFLLFLMSFMSVSLGTSASNTEGYESVGIIEVMLPIPVEVIIPELKFGLDNMKDMICFIKYLKTQSERLNCENSREDVYFVVQTMYNRLKHKKCSWREYYNSPRLNNSKSIRQLKSGDLKQYFSWSSSHDKELFNIAYSCNLGLIDDKYKIPDDVLYFESFKRPPNKGPHVMCNFYAQRRHRFYKHEKIKKV